MPRKHNSFSRALSDANARLQKAMAEREGAQKQSKELNVEIPILQGTIAALKVQINPKGCLGPPTLEEVHEVLHGATPPQDLRTVTEEDLLPEPEGTPLTPED